MVQYETFTLANGLQVITHTDITTPMVAMSILYNVGAKDENEAQTGFAHLFEHLMFGGSVNIPDYDEPLQNAGGENNAYTTNDITNYYLQLPKENVETAFWLESDRMLSLAFNEKSLDVQRKVVCEEFKEHYINKPYGDVWEQLRTLCYTTHPYKWQTIGKELKHVEDATLQDVKNFFAKHYNPSNAMLCVAGNMTKEQVQVLCEKYFAPIPAGEKYIRQLPAEPKQTSARKLVLQREVPVNALYKAYHMGGRLSPEYHAMDLLTEILSGGQSSRLYVSLVKEQQLFSQIDCYHLGSIDPSLVVIDGKVAANVSMQDADDAIEKIIAQLLQDGVTDDELKKAINKTESMIAFEDLSLLNRANNLLYYQHLGDVNMMNTEMHQYEKVTTTDILHYAKEVLRAENCNTMWYLGNGVGELVEDEEEAA
jgi:zinc protease